MEKQTITLKFNKTTKGTVRYKAVDDDAAVRMVYVQKTAFAGKTPNAIQLTVEAIDLEE